MVRIRPHFPPETQHGFSMIEVLVTIVILAIGLLGLEGLELRLQTTVLESYQRAQALLLLDDLASRIASNRLNAASYVTGTGSPLGASATCPTSTSTLQQKDATAWCNTLLGAAEVSGGSKLGALVGGLGCVESLGGNQYLVTVAWQGMGAVGSPPGSTCGQGSYNGVSGCANDVCRRTVSTTVQIANLP